MADGEKVTLRRAERDHEWTTADGKYKLVCWKVAVEKADGTVVEGEMNQKPDSKDPEVGSELEVTITPSERGNKIKKVWKNRGGGGGGDYFKPRDPSDIAGMRRSHAQEMAISYCALMQQRGQLPDDFSRDGHLRPLVDWFEADTRAAEDAAGAADKKAKADEAAQQQQTTTNGDGGEGGQPAATPAAGGGQGSADDIPF